MRHAVWPALLLAIASMACDAAPEQPQIVPGLDATFTMQDSVPSDIYAIAAEEAVARVLSKLGQDGPEAVPPGPPGIVVYGIAACLNSSDCFGPVRPPGPRPAWLVAWLDRGAGTRWASFLVDAQTGEVLAAAPVGGIGV